MANQNVQAVVDESTGPVLINANGNVVATTAAGVNEAVKDEPGRRALRTGLQILVAILLAGGFDVLIQQATDAAPPGLAALMLVLSGMAVTYGQNWAEANGMVVPFLGTKANVKKDTLQ